MQLMLPIRPILGSSRMNTRKTWNFWRFIIFPGGLLILFFVAQEVSQGELWGGVVVILWFLVMGFYINHYKCKCPTCKKPLRLHRYSELSAFLLHYWPSNVKIKCIYCGQLLNERDAGSLGPVIIDNAVMQSRLIHKVDPIYPDSVKSACIYDTVVLAAITNEEGVIIQVKRVKGNPIFAEAAVKAVRQWRYSPMLIDGKPVPVEFDVHLTFLTNGTVCTNSDEK